MDTYSPAWCSAPKTHVDQVGNPLHHRFAPHRPGAKYDDILIPGQQFQVTEAQHRFCPLIHIWIERRAFTCLRRRDGLAHAREVNLTIMI